MTAIVHSSVSVVHLAATLSALVTGTYSVLATKGTRRHRYWGRAYVGSMLLVLATAFGIYTLFGRFGIVHWGAVGSAVALLVGTGSVVLRAVVRQWQRWHYWGMGASVTSLYAALAGESTYRLLPAAYFWWSTLGPASIVLLAGARLLYHYYPATRAGSGAASAVAGH
jgi:uncharacterized membrane protein